MKTLVLQSHRTPLPSHWLAECLDSVKRWAQANRFDYQFMGDEFFDVVPKPLMEKTAGQIVIATDLARLRWLQRYLDQGYDQVIWCDADFLIFDADSFCLPTVEKLPENYALGREVWVQESSNDPRKLKAYKKIHNAFMMFRQKNSFLDFYADHAGRLLEKTTGPMPPQFIGPKLLTALHNVVQCPVVESAGMLSPLVVKDINSGGGRALALFKEKSQTLSAANLCTSMTASGALDDDQITDVIGNLTKGKL